MPEIAQPSPQLTGNTVAPAPDYRGLKYGESKELEQAHSAMAAQAAPAAAGGPPPSAPPQGPSTFDGAVSQALAAAPPQNLNAPTERPDEPGTAGLSIGAGPGPEAYGMATGTRGVTRILDALAATSGNPAVASLAGEAAARNL